MEFEVITTGAAQFPHKTRMLVGGAPGSGKTRFALTAKNPLFLAARPGITTLAIAGGVPIVDIFTENQLFQVKKVLSYSPERREEILGFPVDTLVVDTVDELQRRLLTGRLDKERRTEVKSDDWNWIASRMNKIFEGLGELDLDIIYLTHLKEVGGYDDKYTVKPNLQGGFVEQIHGHVDMSLVIKSSYVEPTETELEIVTVGDTSHTKKVEVQLDPVDRSYLMSRGNDTYEWVNDKSNVMEPFEDLNFVDDFQRISARRAEIQLQESSVREIDDFAIEVGAVEPAKPEPMTSETPPEEILPGTSSNDRVAAIIARQKSNKK